MVRGRFADGGKTDKDQTGEHRGSDCIADSDKRDAIKGFKKLAAIIILFVVIVILQTYVASVVTVVGDSMSSTLTEGDLLVIQKFGTSDIERFDVVIAEIPGQTIIKRVIGLPGETIRIMDGKVFVDGEELRGEFEIYTEDAGIANELFTLGADEYFLMGDNRSGSYDSRSFGAVKLEQITGIAVVRILPIWEFKIL